MQVRGLQFRLRLQPRICIPMLPQILVQTCGRVRRSSSSRARNAGLQLQRRFRLRKNAARKAKNGISIGNVVRLRAGQAQGPESFALIYTTRAESGNGKVRAPGNWWIRFRKGHEFTGCGKMRTAGGSRRVGCRRKANSDGEGTPAITQKVSRNTHGCPTAYRWRFRWPI